MTPISIAKNLYAKHGKCLEEDLALFLDRGGYINKTPDSLMLFRPALTSDPARWLDDGSLGDAWFVHLACGKAGPRRFFDQQPYTLPYLMWCRNFGGPVHIYSTAAFRRHLT